MGDVAKVYAGFPEGVRKFAVDVRALIYETAEVENVGAIVETLKWGQPAYLTAPNIGSTIRLGWSAKKPNVLSVYFICTTHLVDRFCEIYPDTFVYEGGRAIHLDLNASIPKKELSHCFAMALTYHKNKR